MNSPTFADLGLSAPLLRALRERGYEAPTPIQVGAIPHLLEGRDLLGIAQTGTGKTAAFALPTLQYLAESKRPAARNAPRALILTPTRELAAQIGESFRAYGRDTSLRTTVIFGGVGQGAQVKALRQGVAVLVATPGRLLDLMNQGHIDLGEVEVFVLDEADRMLDMGFIHDVRKVIKELPRKRQSLLFSATMPPDIVDLSSRLLHQPLRVEVAPPATTVEQVVQRVYLVEKRDKRTLLGELLEDNNIVRALIFTRTRHGADRVARHLRKLDYKVDAIHSDKSQGARERALEAFRRGKILALVATDIAARGIDVPDITHVFNFDLPNLPEAYVHRIGRTARAGREGVALSFCDVDEREYLRDIEKTTRQQIEIVPEHSYRSTVPLAAPTPQRKAPGRGQRRRRPANTPATGAARPKRRGRSRSADQRR